MENSYIAIARQAKIGITCMYRKGASNEFAASASKTAERYLKAVIEIYGDASIDPSVLKTHSMKRLYKACQKIEGFNLDKKDTDALSGYYFEASYPGDNFVEVSEEEEDACFEALNNIADAVEKFI